MTKQQVDQAINELISAYVFPFEALLDVHTRLLGCTDVHYAAQQLRYLQKLVDAGLANERIDGHEINVFENKSSL